MYDKATEHKYLGFIVNNNFTNNRDLKYSSAELPNVILKYRHSAMVA
jgi:hypothetical protein